MKKTFLLLSITLSLFAGAQTITCNELPNATTEKYGYYLRFVITLNSQKQITQIHALNWNAKTDKEAGYDSAATRLASEKPLNPKKVESELVYSYFFQDEGDGDYPGPKTRVTYRLPESLKGRAEVIEDAGDSGVDDFIVDCQ